MHLAHESECVGDLVTLGADANLVRPACLAARHRGPILGLAGPGNAACPRGVSYSDCHGGMAKTCASSLLPRG